MKGPLVLALAVSLLLLAPVVPAAEATPLAAQDEGSDCAGPVCEAINVVCRRVFHQDCVD